MGAEAEDCHLSGYTHVYINGRIGDILILERISIKGAYIINIVLHHKNVHSNVTFFEHYDLYHTSTTQHFAKIVLGG